MSNKGGWEALISAESAVAFHPMRGGSSCHTGHTPCPPVRRTTRPPPPLGCCSSWGRYGKYLVAVNAGTESSAGGSDHPTPASIQPTPRCRALLRRRQRDSLDRRGLERTCEVLVVSAQQ